MVSEPGTSAFIPCTEEGRRELERIERELSDRDQNLRTGPS